MTSIQVVCIAFSFVWVVCFLVVRGNFFDRLAEGFLLAGMLCGFTYFIAFLAAGTFGFIT